MTESKVSKVSIDATDRSLQIHTATKNWEKQEIFRLRYQVYVQEMAKNLQTCSNNNQISDPLDNQSILLYAQSGHDIIGTTRLTIAAAENYPADLVETFDMYTFKAISADLPSCHLALGTKLAILPEYRNSPVLFLLLAETYRILREHTVPFFFGGCNPNLIPLYERMGFRRFARNFTDPGYGLLVPLVMLVEGISHFQAIKSPLYRHVRKYKNSMDISQRFLQAFPEAAKHINTQLVTPEYLWEHVCEKLLISPYTIPAFKNLDKESIMDILAIGALFHCSHGECILYPDTPCNDLYILISGALQATSKTGSRILHPGDHFGSFAFPEQGHQDESVSALTDAEVFVLPGQAFTRYQHFHRHPANMLLSNITGNRGFATACATLTEQGGNENE